MTVWIVGNSHAASLLSAYRAEEGRWPALDAEFSITPGRNAPNFTAREGRLVPRPNSRMQSTRRDAEVDGIDVAAADAVVVSAVGISAARTDHLERGTHPLNLAALLGWPEPGVPGAQPISRQAFGELIRESVIASGAFQAARDAARLCRGPILLQPVPRPSAAVLAEPGWPLVRHFGREAGAIYAEFAGIVDTVIAEAAATLGPRVVLLRQEALAIDGHGYMREEYGRPGDPWHANAAYGALVLDAVCHALALRNSPEAMAIDDAARGAHRNRQVGMRIE